MRPAPYFLLALFGCAGAPSGADGAVRDTLVIAQPSDAHDLLSVVYQSPFDGNLLANLNLPLLDTDFDCELEFKPALAKSWTFSEDGRSIRMELDESLTWEDGAPVTAEDVRFTYALIADPDVRSPMLDRVSSLTPKGRPKVIGPSTIEWVFERAYDRTAMLALVSRLPPVPQHLLASKTVARSKLREHPLNAQSPIGDGPWKVAEWTRNQRIVLVPNDHFTGPDELRPKLAAVRFEVIPEYEARIAALKAGEVDLVEGVLVSDADVLSADHPEVQLHRRGWRSMEYVAWNSLDPKAPGASRLFADPEVRRALSMAIDSDALIRELLTSPATGEVYGRPAIGTITPALCGMHNDTIRRLPFSPDDARARLGELGWADTNNDGWLDKDGEAFRFTLITNAATPRRTLAAALVKEHLAAVGIDVQVEQIEATTFFERLRARDFEAALSSWTASLYADPSAIWAEDSEFNLTSYRNPRVSELLDQGLREADPTRVAPIWKELQAVIYEDQPYTFLYWADETVAVNDRFLDTTVDLLGAWRNLHRWQVPPERVKRATPAGE